MNRLLNKKTLFEKYYILLYLSYTVFVFVSSFRVGVLASFITLLVFLPYFRKKIDSTDFIVLAYFIWAFVSILFSDLSSKSLDLYSSKFMNAFFPVLFFFLGGNPNIENGKKEKFFYYFKIALIYCFVLGLFWYITEPDYYIHFMERTTSGFYLINYHNDKRFCSFLGSIGIGLLSVIGVIIFLTEYFKNQLKRNLIGTVCMIAMGVLSMQRSAYIMLAIFVAWIILFNTRRSPVTSFAVIGFALVFVSISFVFLPTVDVFQQIVGRVEKINVFAMISSRVTGQWSSLFDKSFIAILFGDGVGSHSQGSMQAFNDGAFVNIISEIGLVGLFLFFTIIVKCCFFYWRRKVRLCPIPFMISIAFLLNGVGSNGILYMDLAPVFWFSLGLLKGSKSL